MGRDKKSPVPAKNLMNSSIKFQWLLVILFSKFRNRKLKSQSVEVIARIVRLNIFYRAEEPTLYS